MVGNYLRQSAGHKREKVVLEAIPKTNGCVQSDVDIVFRSLKPTPRCVRLTDRTSSGICSASFAIAPVDDDSPYAYEEIDLGELCFVDYAGGEIFAS